MIKQIVKVYNKQERKAVLDLSDLEIFNLEKGTIIETETYVFSLSGHNSETIVLYDGPFLKRNKIEIFSNLRVAIIALSDKGYRGEREDTATPLIKNLLETEDYSIVYELLLPDEKSMLKENLIKIADSYKADLIITTGGTGLSPRDNTPEATLEVAEKNVPGIAEAMRAEGLKNTSRAMLSRGVSVIRKSTLIINLPGSPKAVKENLTAILPCLSHALYTLRDSVQDCAIK